MSDLAPCRHRRVLRDDRFSCIHPGIRAPGEFGPAICRACISGGGFCDQDVPTPVIRPRENFPTAVEYEESLPCIYRSEEVRRQPCELCGGREGAPVSVYHCSKFNEQVSMRKWGSRSKAARDMRACIRCDCRAELPPVNACLMVLQPREIPRAVDSIGSLIIDKVWFRAFQEKALPGPVNEFIERNEYKYYLVVADDVVVTPEALAAVLSLLPEYGAATGYCGLCHDSLWMNVCKKPVTLNNGSHCQWEDYTWYHRDEIKAQQRPTFVTWFGGWCLTGLSRDTWLKHPFGVNTFTGAQSDHDQFFRMQTPIVGHRDAFCEHLKENVQDPLKTNWLVGKEEPRVIYEPLVPRAANLETSRPDGPHPELLRQH